MLHVRPCIRFASNLEIHEYGVSADGFGGMDASDPINDRYEHGEEREDRRAKQAGRGPLFLFGSDARAV